MNRQDHLQWAKDRALEILEKGDITGAWTSFVSDMGKHNDLKDHMAINLGMQLLFSGNLSAKDQMKDWINGFN